MEVGVWKVERWWGLDVKRWGNGRVTGGITFVTIFHLTWIFCNLSHCATFLTTFLTGIISSDFDHPL